MTGLTVLVALAAAVSFGWSTAAMHYGASGAPDDVGGPLALVRHLLTHRLWLSGMVASLSGLALHGIALRIGSLAIVQPVVVSGLVFSLLFRSALDRRLPARPVLGWAALTASGLAVFLVAAGSTTGARHPSGVGSAIVLGAGTLVAIACWVVSGRVGMVRAGLLLGLGAGINFGLTAGTLKATSSSSSVADAATSWPVYVLIVLGISGFVANQVAYRRAPLANSLPILNLANPVVSLLYGVVAFQERPATGGPALVGEAFGLAVVLLGIYRLAQHEDDPDARPAEDRALETAGS